MVEKEGYFKMGRRGVLKRGCLPGTYNRFEHSKTTCAGRPLSSVSLLFGRLESVYDGEIEQVNPISPGAPWSTELERPFYQNVGRKTRSNN